MAMTQKTVVVAVFPGEDQARQAIDELRRAGFSDNEVGFLTCVRTVGTEEEVAAKTAGGMVEGSIVGGVLGAAVAVLIPGIGPALAGGILVGALGGAALGAAAGGLIGSLVGLGVSERDALFYQRELEAGRTIVTVKTTSAADYDEVLAIMRRHGAYDAATQSGVINAEPPIRQYGTTNPQETYDPDSPSSRDDVR